MMFLLGFLLAVFLFLIFPHLWNLVFNVHLLFIYAPRDLFNYFRYRKWNECKEFGFIDAYCSDSSKPFGNGKTLSGTWKVRNIYHKYNGKKIYDYDNKKWIKQEIIILSNVHFTDINYIYLRSVEQILSIQGGLKYGQICLVYIDEAGSIFNSRNFKDNISQPLLQSMLTCRKQKFGMIITAQRHNQIDALIRQLISRVYMVDKFWRSVVLEIYNGYDLEYCTNVDLLKPMGTIGYFATNKLFASYDTGQQIEDIKKAQVTGQLLSNEEILVAQGNVPTDILNVNRGNRKFKKIVRVLNDRGF